MSVVLVAVPARNEAATIGSCLRSIDRAAGRTAIPVLVVVAADTCTDDTIAVARATPLRHCRLVIVEGRWRGPGGARAAATAAGLTRVDAPTDHVWIASTDADCAVPRSWLLRQIAVADAGHDAVAGVVHLAPDAPAELRAWFLATYETEWAAHRHVHGANLGVRASAYVAVSGWRTSTIVGEDHHLWRRLVAADVSVVQPPDLYVTTSHRTRSRVIGGFAAALARRLDTADEQTA